MRGVGKVYILDSDLGWGGEKKSLYDFIKTNGVFLMYFFLNDTEGVAKFFQKVEKTKKYIKIRLLLK